MTIREAVELAKKNNQEGFTYLYETTYKDKYYVAYKYMKNEDAANDVLQDAYIKAFSKLDTLSDPDKFEGWLGMIVANTAKNALAKNNPMLFSELEAADEDGNVKEFDIEDESETANVELQFDQKERAKILSGLIDSLSDEQRLCILMFYFEKKSIADISKTLDVTESTIKTRLHYGKKNLKKKCEEYEKQGYKFLGVAPVGLLLFLLGGDKASACSMLPAASGNAVKEIIAKATNNAATKSAEVSGAGTSTAGTSSIANKGAAGMGTEKAMNAANFAGKSANIAGKTASAAVKKGLFASVGAKIAVAVTAVAITGAVVAGVTLLNKNSNDKNSGSDNSSSVSSEMTENDNTTPTVAPTEIPTPTPTPDPAFVKKSEERELLLTYKKDVLIPEYSELKSCDSNEFLSIAVEEFGRNFELKEEGAKGIFSSTIDDFDADGTQEMLVFYITPYFESDEHTDADYRGCELNYIVCTVVDGAVVETYNGDFAVEDSFIAGIIDDSFWSYEQENFRPADNKIYPVPVFDFAANNTDLTISRVKNADKDTYIVFESEIKQEKTNPRSIMSVWKLVEDRLVFDFYYSECETDYGDYYDKNQYEYIYSSEAGKGEVNNYSYWKDSVSGEESNFGYSIGADTGYVKDETNIKIVELSDLYSDRGLKLDNLSKINHVESTSSEIKPESKGDIWDYRYWGDRYDFEFEAGTTFYHGFYID